MAYFVDEARAIDARSIMSRALKSGRRATYDDTVSWPDRRFPREGAYLVSTLRIDVQWPAHPNNIAHASVLFRYPDEDGRFVDQTLVLVGTPVQVGGWRWLFVCPDTNQHVRTLYFAPDGQHFQSRDAAQLKARPRSKFERRRLRYFQLRGRLQTGQCGPVIIDRPADLTQAEFDRLRAECEKEYIRYLCAALGRPDPEFWDDDDEEQPVEPGSASRSAPKSASRSAFKPPPKPRSAQPPPPSACKSLPKPPSKSVVRNLGRGRYVRDASGVLVLRSKARKKSVDAKKPFDLRGHDFPPRHPPSV